MRGAHARGSGAAARRIAIGAVVVGAVVVVGIGLLAGGRSPEVVTAAPAGGSSRPTVSPTPSAAVPSTAPTAPVSGPFHLATVSLDIVDPTRTIAPPHSGAAGPAPRRLPTFVWYPSLHGLAPPTSGFPLVVFAHGFDVTPLRYRPLLRSWARAGYVVAAPTFPLTNPDALGGLDEADIVNQPADVRFVITRLLAASRDPTSALAGLVDRSAIAVAGHSDGAETMMAVAYDTCCRDDRVDAAMILSGRPLDIAGGRYYAPGSPPLLVAQGTADTINPPWFSERLFATAPRPKVELLLEGGDHLSPFSTPGPSERAVARVTTSFLDAVLKRTPGAVRRMHRVARGDAAKLVQAGALRTGTA